MNNQSIYCPLGKVEVLEQINAGSQGTVFKVRVAGKEYAYKAYYKASKSLIDNIRRLINDPVEDYYKDLFSWPICEVTNGSIFGYLMDLVDMSRFTLYTNRKNIRLSEQNMILSTKIAINLCDAFNALHSHQNVYKDLSAKNFFFDPDTGDIKIIDNDNITRDGCDTQVYGTPGFIAPEIITNQNSKNPVFPTLRTDRFSLAVMLFKIFSRIDDNPLYDKRAMEILDSDIDESKKDLMIFGVENANFVFRDKNDVMKYMIVDDPDYPTVAAWKELPDYVQDEFRTVFVEGIKNPLVRTTPSKWIKVLSRFLASLMEIDAPDGLLTCSRDLRFDPTERPLEYYIEEFDDSFYYPIAKILLSKNKVNPVSGKDYINVMLHDGFPIYYGYFNYTTNRRSLEKILDVEVNGNGVRLTNVCNYVIKQLLPEKDINGNHIEKYLYRGEHTEWIKGVAHFIVYLKNTIKIRNHDQDMGFPLTIKA